MDSERFPCLALQLEEQARALEDAWACCDEPGVPSLSIPLDSFVRTNKPGYEEEAVPGLSACGNIGFSQEDESVSGQAASRPSDWAGEDSCCTALSPQRPRTPRDRRKVPSPARLLLTSVDTSSTMTLPTPRQEARPLSVPAVSSPAVSESRPAPSIARSSAAAGPSTGRTPAALTATSGASRLRTRRATAEAEDATTRRPARGAGSALAVRAARRAGGRAEASTPAEHPLTPGPQRRPRRAAATAAAASFAAVANGGGVSDAGGRAAGGDAATGPGTSARTLRVAVSASKTSERPSRRAVVQWNRDVAIDPRTGKAVEGPMTPGSFCSQCGALSTPVWRAGPFGHKTLCNACGVRWMKVAKKEYARHLC